MKDRNKKKNILRPNPETLHTSDPQEKMRGPVSSTMNKIEKEAEENNSETRREADRKKQRRM